MKPLSILIVEDHPLQHIYLQNLLSELGDFLLETAEDGKEALERLRQRDFDLVLTDLLMPGMDGVQFIQCLASLRCKPALAIMSAASRRMLMAASLVAKNLDVEVLGLISKPVNAEALRTLVNQLRNRVRTPTPELPEHMDIDRHTLVQAMSSGQFQAWFQPKNPGQRPYRRCRSPGALDAPRTRRDAACRVPAGNQGVRTGGAAVVAGAQASDPRPGTLAPARL